MQFRKQLLQETLRSGPRHSTKHQRRASWIGLGVISSNHRKSSPAPLSNSLVPLSNDQPGRITQILSGTYAESVLQTQLGNQGRVQGNLVSSFPPYEKLFNPNATTLVGASLLATHSQNTELSQAEQLQLVATLTPGVSTVATWINPHSGWFAKGVSVLGLLPLASVVAKPVLTQLGSLSAEAGELGRFSSEFDELGNLTSSEEEAAEKGTALHHIFPQEFRGAIRRTWDRY